MSDSTFMERLLEVQRDLKAPKSRTNTFGKYSYRSAEDILEAVKPLLVQHGLLLTISDEIVEVGGRVYVKATAKVGDGNGSAIATTAYAREDADKKGMDAAQLTGATSSYARKYALNGLFCIDDDKDPDTDEYQKQTRPSAPKTEPKTPHADKPITNQQKGQLFALASEIAEKNGWPREWVKDDLYAHFNVQSTTQLTTAQAQRTIRALYAVKDKGATFLDALTKEQ